MYVRLYIRAFHVGHIIRALVAKPYFGKSTTKSIIHEISGFHNIRIVAYYHSLSHSTVHQTAIFNINSATRKINATKCQELNWVTNSLENSIFRIITVKAIQIHS